MKCSKCGTEIPEGAKFCFNCGAPISTKDSKENLTLANNVESVSDPFASLKVEELDTGSLFGEIEEVPSIDIKEEILEDPFSIQMNQNTESQKLEAKPQVEPSKGIKSEPESSLDTSNTIPEENTTPAKTQNIETVNPIDFNPPVIESSTPIDNNSITIEEPKIDSENKPINNGNVQAKESNESIPKINSPFVNDASKVNKVTMGGVISGPASVSVTKSDPISFNKPSNNNGPIIPSPSASTAFDNTKDLITDRRMSPTPVNNADNTFGQPNFDQYSVNMMYGNNTEEEQYKRMQKNQIKPASSFETFKAPLPGQGANVHSDFGGNNTNVETYQSQQVVNNVSNANNSNPNISNINTKPNSINQTPGNKPVKGNKKKKIIISVIIEILLIAALVCIYYFSIYAPSHEGGNQATSNDTQNITASQSRTTTINTNTIINASDENGVSNAVASASNGTNAENTVSKNSNKTINTISLGTNSTSSNSVSGKNATTLQLGKNNVSE